MSISVLGAGAFGTSLALSLAQTGMSVTLWCRNQEQARQMAETRETGPRLPGHTLPEGIHITAEPTAFQADVCLIAVPSQQLSGFLKTLPKSASALIACCKGIDRATGLGPVSTIAMAHPDATAAILTGPSFAADIARGLPTALVLACQNAEEAARLQSQLTRPTLRIYRTTDVIGAELGGALKNVIALAAGMTIGAGLGDSARASVMARGFSELQRFAVAKGARTETLQGLSGLGDLFLTATSEKSRNFTAGIAFGKGLPPDPGATIEGIATAPAVSAEAASLGLQLPLISAVSHVASGALDIASAVETLMARPVGKE